jgi:hypothetical protein
LSPILVRPVREQLEHDRVIRQLQKDLSRRKMEVSINPGAEQNVAVGTGARREFPDAVLFSIDKARKILGIIEVETGESINHLEAMAQWVHYARLKAPFHLYVPMGSADLARRLTVEKQIAVAEIHTYHQIGDMVRFGSAYRSGTAPKLPDDPLPPDPAQKAIPAPGLAAPPAPAKKAAPVPMAKPAKLAPVIASVVKNGKAAAKPSKVVAATKPVAGPVKPVAPVKPAAAPTKTVAPPRAAAAPAKTAVSAKTAAPVKTVAPVKVAATSTKKVVPPPKKVAAVKAKPLAKKAAKPAPAKKAAPKKAAGKRK